MNDEIFGHFGRAPTFTVVDDDGNVNIHPNTSEHLGGVGMPPDIIAGTGANVMVCGGLGRKAVVRFNELGIEVYVQANGNVSKALDDLRKGGLPLADSSNACQEHTYRGQ